MSEECDVEEVAAVLEDECARTILASTSERPMSVEDLHERCDASKPTIYRRIEDLRDCDMLAARTRPDEGGHHYEVYSARLDRVTVELADGEFDLHVERTEDMSDRFTRLIEEM